MSLTRVTLSILVLSVLLSGCSKPDNSKPAAEKAMFAGCPLTTPGEEFSGGGSAIPKGIFSNSPTRVYAVGVVQIPNTPDQAVIRLSTDGGNGFSIFDQSTGPKGEGAVNNAITADTSNRNVYVAQTYNNGSVKSANIHYSNDNGGSWKDAPFQLNPQNNENLTGVVLSSGKAFFVGTSEDPSHAKTGFLIALDVDNNKATLVSTLENAEFKQVATQGANVLVVGSLFSADKSQTSWLFNRWDDSEKKWVSASDGFPNVLDDPDDETFLNLKRFSQIYSELKPIRDAALVGAAARAQSSTPVPPKPVQTPLNGGANAVLVTPDGFIFVAGTVKAPNTNEPDVWVVRKSANSGASFTVSDLFNDGAFTTLVPYGLVDYDGHTIAVGGSKNVSTHSHWHIRGEQNRFSSWITMGSPKFSTNPDESAQAVGAVITGFGDKKYLIVLGDSHEKDGIHHWRIQQTTSCFRPH